jgi:hypothetical protein
MTDFDPFVGEVDGYAPEKFYTKAYDHRGHTATFRWGKGSEERINIPQYMLTTIQQIRSACPVLRTNADLIRDALLHYVHMRQSQLKDTMPAEWHQRVDLLAQNAEMDLTRCIWEENEQTLGKMEDMLRAAKTDSQKEVAKHICQDIATSLSADYLEEAAKIIDRYCR